VYATGCCHDVWATEAHRIGQDEIAGLDVPRLSRPLGRHLLLCGRNIFPANFSIPDLDPVHAIGAIGDESVDRSWRCAAFDYAKLAEFSQWPFEPSVCFVFTIPFPAEIVVAIGGDFVL